MPPVTKNLGLVRAIHEGVNPPLNVKMLWYNTNPGENIHYYYDTVDFVWKPLTGSGSGTPTVYTFTDSNTVDFSTSGNNVTASTKISPNAGNIIQALSNGLFAGETLTALTGLTLTGQTLNAFYRDEVGTTTTRSVDLSSAFVDVNVSNTTFDPNTYILTTVETDGSTHTVNLSELIKINVVDSTSIDFSGDGTAATPLTGSVKKSPNVGNILQLLSNGLYVPTPPTPEKVEIPIQLPELRLKVNKRTYDPKGDGKQQVWYDKGGKAYDDILVSWDQEDKRFLELNPKVYLFVYRNHKKSKKENRDYPGGWEQTKTKKGYVHPTDINFSEIGANGQFYGGIEKVYRNVQPSVLHWDTLVDITNEPTNKNTVFELQDWRPKNFYRLDEFNALQWFYLRHIYKSKGVYIKGDKNNFNITENTPANFYRPDALRGTYYKCLTTHGGKNATIDDVVDNLNTKGVPNHRETVWFKFAIVCENPNPQSPEDTFLIGPLSEALCLRYFGDFDNTGGAEKQGTGHFRIHPEHRKIKWNSGSGETLHKDSEYLYVGEDGMTDFYDNWVNTDADEQFYPKVRYRRYGDIVRLDGSCWINPKDGFANGYVAGDEVTVFRGLQLDHQPEMDLLFDVHCLLDGGIEIVTVKLYAYNGSLAIINLPESSTFVLYLDAIEYYVGPGVEIPA